MFCKVVWQLVFDFIETFIDERLAINLNWLVSDSTGIKRSLQVVWESFSSEHSLWIIAFIDISLAIDSEMETCASSVASCHALCCSFAIESCQGFTKSWSGRDEASVHAALGSLVCCGGMCRRRRREERTDESLRLSFFDPNNIGELLRESEFNINIWNLVSFSAFCLSIRAYRSSLERIGFSKLSTRERNQTLARLVGVSIAKRSMFPCTSQATSSSNGQLRQHAIGRSFCR